MRAFLLIGAFVAAALLVVLAAPGVAWADHFGGHVFVGPRHFGGHGGFYGHPRWGFSLGLGNPWYLYPYAYPYSYAYPYPPTPYGYYSPYGPTNVYPYGFNFRFGR